MKDLAPIAAALGAVITTLGLVGPRGPAAPSGCCAINQLAPETSELSYELHLRIPPTGVTDLVDRHLARATASDDVLRRYRSVARLVRRQLIWLLAVICGLSLLAGTGSVVVFILIGVPWQAALAAGTVVGLGVPLGARVVAPLYKVVAKLAAQRVGEPGLIDGERGQERVPASNSQ